MNDRLRLSIYMFPARLWKWNFCIVWSDGMTMVSTKPSWGYSKTFARANQIAQEARCD